MDKIEEILRSYEIKEIRHHLADWLKEQGDKCVKNPLNKIGCAYILESDFNKIIAELRGKEKK